ncbi:lipoprotein [Chitinimonas sp.]|uniref:LptM family lipoprotein n=1 Tax=Chitinimonas sp. TaxID=1934313 RepID=UPI0035B118E0
MKAAALIMMTLALTLAACGRDGSSYMNAKGAQRPEPVPEEKDADWRLYGQTPEFETKVSWASIGHKDRFGPPEYVYVWVWRKFAKDQEPPKGREYRNEFTRFALDCAKGSMASIAIERQDHEGERVKRSDVPGYQWEFDAVAKQTYMQDFFDQVCKIAREKAAVEGKDG